MGRSSPVPGKLTLWNVPRFIAEASGVFEGRNDFDLSDGQLTSEGTIVWPSPEKENDMFKVSMGSKKKLNATFSFRTKSGSAVLRKK